MGIEVAIIQWGEAMAGEKKAAVPVMEPRLDEYYLM